MANTVQLGEQLERTILRELYSATHPLPTMLQVGSWPDFSRNQSVVAVRGSLHSGVDRLDATVRQSMLPFAELPVAPIVDLIRRVAERAHYIDDCYQGIRDLVDQ